MDKEAENQLAQEEEEQRAGRGILFFFFFPFIDTTKWKRAVGFPLMGITTTAVIDLSLPRIDFLPQHKLFLKMPLNGFLFAGRVGISGWACSGRSRIYLSLKSERKSGGKRESLGKK